jgi:cobalamin synthase
VVQPLEPAVGVVVVVVVALFSVEHILYQQELEFHLMWVMVPLVILAAQAAIVTLALPQPQAVAQAEYGIQQHQDVPEVVVVVAEIVLLTAADLECRAVLL